MSNRDATLHSLGYERGYAAGYRDAQAAMPPREPTPGMVNAGREEILGPRAEDKAPMRRAWRAMYDAWQNEQTSGSTEGRADRMTGERATATDTIAHVADDGALPASVSQAGIKPGPLDPIADLVRRLRDYSPFERQHVVHDAADALERLALELDYWIGETQRYAGNAEHWMNRAERAEAERDALRECVREADRMRWSTRCQQYENPTYDAARAKVKP